MSDTPKPVLTEISPPRRSSGARPLFWLALAALIALLGYQWHLRNTAETAARQELLLRLQREVAGLRQQAETQSQKQIELSGALAQIGGLVEGGRTRLQLAAVEQLLLLANDRLQLARDVYGALQALKLADARLAALKEPRLYPVREALAREQAALAALPAADTAGIALALAQIMDGAARFPLRARLPERFEPETPAALPADGTFSQRVLAAIKTALSAIFTLRRSEGPALRLLAPEEEILAARILQLKLEGARIALLSGDGASMRDLSRSAGAWLRGYYLESDPAVRAALAELDRLAGIDTAPKLPDISRSLALLRAQLESPGAAP